MVKLIYYRTPPILQCHRASFDRFRRHFRLVLFHPVILILVLLLGFSAVCCCSGCSGFSFQLEPIRRIGGFGRIVSLTFPELFQTILENNLVDSVQPSLPSATNHRNDGVGCTYNSLFRIDLFQHDIPELSIDRLPRPQHCICLILQLD